MSVQMILLPLFVQVLLTIAIGILLAMRRRRAFATGTHYRDIALREPNWPKDALQAGYCYQNQFEFPVLFYVLTILALITKQADFLFVQTAREMSHDGKKLMLKGVSPVTLFFTDRPERIAGEALSRATDFVFSLAALLDREAARKRPNATGKASSCCRVVSLVAESLSDSWELSQLPLGSYSRSARRLGSSREARW